MSSPASRTGRPQEKASWRVDRSGAVLGLSGTLRIQDAPSVVMAVRDATRDVKTIELNLDEVQHIDGGVVALLRGDFAIRGVHAQLRGSDRFRALFELYGESHQPRPSARGWGRIAAHVGQAAIRDVVDVEKVLSFVGEMTFAVGRLLRDPRRGHWREIPILVERAGADAVPVVLVINFLIGFVMAYMSAHALAAFGATVYVADLVGIAVTRQLAPLMTAFVVCGRSGAAFASELGSMNVSEETDALRTLGLDPMSWLVVPRLLALVLVVPLLTLMADFIGIAGGLFVAVTSLDLTTRGYINQTCASLVRWDIGSGLVMSVAFAVAIALIACQQGLAVSGGAEGVGRGTTTTVVASLFAIVVLDTILTILYRTFGVS